jgi:hypothetical protein
MNQRLGSNPRLHTLVFLQNETDQMVTEINNLLESKRILERALAETENPLHIAQECLYSREKRQAIDLVHDHVEKELIKVRTKKTRTNKNKSV